MTTRVEDIDPDDVPRKSIPVRNYRPGYDPWGRRMRKGEHVPATVVTEQEFLHPPRRVVPTPDWPDRLMAFTAGFLTAWVLAGGIAITALLIGAN